MTKAPMDAPKSLEQSQDDSYMHNECDLAWLEFEEFDVEQAYIIAAPLPGPEELYVRPPVGFEHYWSEGGTPLDKDTSSA